jgi:putative ABC transport system permease protein
VRIELLEGRVRTLPLRLAATVDEVFGLNAYMERTALNRLLADGDLSTGVVLHVQPGMAEHTLAAIRDLPRVAGAWSESTMLANMEEITARHIRIMSTVMTSFAAIIAVGVVYNIARIALSERAWEFASLRVLGFTRAEVSSLLLGELAIVIAIAIPVGMLFGFALVMVIAEALTSDQFHFPVVIDAASYASAALCVLVSGVVAGLIVRRNIDRLDLVAVLKTRE